MAKAERKTYAASVRTLVEYILRTGDIDSSFSSGVRANLRALEGTRLHKKLQKSEGSGYMAEVPMEKTFAIKDKDGQTAACLTVEGRADGLFRTDWQGQTLWAVDEIKSTDLKLEDVRKERNELHWAQAYFYACFLAQEKDLDKVLVRLSYVQTETEEVTRLYECQSRSQLEAFVQKVVDSYSRWILWSAAWQKQRDQSLSGLTFPFDSFRPGQRQMAALVYSTIKDGKKIFLEAPTGIGKTMSALFPALKAMGEGRTEKIFYLTAKNVTAEAVLKADQLLRTKSHMQLAAIRITAKDRICFQTQKGRPRRCNPVDCPYAKGHYDRVNDACLWALDHEKQFSKQTIETVAEKFKVCPYELSLDIAVWCDLLICDYNYAFDPSTSLKRFFASGKQPFTLLIDEAHNLVDRARDMFTADISKKDFLTMRRKCKKGTPLYKALGRVNDLFLECKKSMPEGTDYLKADLSSLEGVLPDADEVMTAETTTAAPAAVTVDTVTVDEDGIEHIPAGTEGKMQDNLASPFLDPVFMAGIEAKEDPWHLDLSWYRALNQTADLMGQYFAEHSGQMSLEEVKIEEEEESWQLYFRLLFFLRIWNQRSEGYEDYMQIKGGDMLLRFFCVDPSQVLKSAYKSVSSVIFFSATLEPIEYYQRLLGADDAKAVALDSPFDHERMKVMTASVPVTYRYRQTSIPAVSDLIAQTVRARDGHYMVFFSSFAYLGQVYKDFTMRYPEFRTIKQEPGMSEDQRQDFLEHFQKEGSLSEMLDPEFEPDRTLIGFCVLSGVFSEGIDLKGESLIGVIVVSVGLPQIGLERDLIKENIDRRYGNGFEYAYVYPGMGHVLQAAGRLIRTEEDKGVVLLIDQRFSQARYKKLFPRQWQPVRPVTADTLSTELDHFWQSFDRENHLSNL